MHCCAAEKIDLFHRNFNKPDGRIDMRLLKQSNQYAEENRHVLQHWSVELLAKQALPFRGNSDYRVDFPDKDVNRDNFVATLHLFS